MNMLAPSILLAILKTGILLSLSAVAVATFLRVCRIGSPTVRRTAYVAVLVQGWLLFESPFSVPLPTFISKVVGSPTVGLGQRSPAHQFRGEDNVVSGKENGQAEPSVDGDPTLVSRLHSLGCHWRELRPAIVFGSSSSVDYRERVRATPAVQDRSSLAADDKWTSNPSQKSTGGPKLPPVAPERELAATAAVIADRLPTDKPLFPWPLALVSVWATGIAFIAGRSVWAYVRFVRWFPASCETPPEWADEWTSLQLEAGLPGTVPLVAAEHAGPVLCRLPHGYRLIVPAEAWRTLDQSQRLLILRHELAHIERHDVWKSLVMRILALPHWFNPLVWHIVRRFDESAEWACDEAAAGAAPDRVPDYARALLQLSHRAQPAFFATSAARTHGLAHRIRRLLTPAANKGTKMKTTVMAALLLGISLLNVARLQTRAEGNSSADDDKVHAPRATPAAADKPVVTKQDLKTNRRLVTVQVPVTKTIMVPVITTEMVPQQAFVEPSIDAPPAIVRPVAEPLGVVASTPLQTRADEQRPSAADEKTKTPPPAAAPPVKKAPAAKASGNNVWRHGAPDFGAAFDGEVPWNFEPEGSAHVGYVPREARVNLSYILQHMHRFEREREELKASLAQNEKREAGKAEEIKIAQKRVAEEKDLVIRSFLEKGITQQVADMQRDHRRGSDRLIQREKEMYHRNFDRIMQEIASYAKEHKILVVRRMPFPNERRAEVAPGLPSESDTASPASASDPGTPVAVTTQSMPVFLGNLGAQPHLPPPVRTPVAAAAPPPVFTFAVVGPAANAPMRIVTPAPAQASSVPKMESNSLSGPWDKEILYVAEVHGELIPDVSDEIVKRLNASDAEKGKTSRTTPK